MILPDLGVGLEECKVCHKKHPAAWMKIHMKNKHIDKFQCNYCERAFTSKERLAKHIRSHTGYNLFHFRKIVKILK